MGVTMRRTRDGFAPAARCDRCGADVPGTGYGVWRVDVAPGTPDDGLVLLVCGDACLEPLLAEREGDWVATPVDALLVSLLHTMAIDPEAVLRRELADWAAWHTRNEAPD
ncbi:MAG: hypothetical protein QJR03_07420 [Sphaerobacter sp.]|nr:hypothetical protein [Sphaerobacter sp.]